MRVVLPARDWPPGLACKIAPLALLPDDLRAWIRTAVGRELSAGARLELVSERETATDTGWPMRLVEAHVVEGSAIREVRLAALYAFFEHGGSAVIAARDRGTLEPHREAAVAWLRAARPEFSGEVATLAELWDLDELRPADRAPSPGAARPDPGLSSEQRLARLATTDTAEARRERAALLLDLGQAEAALPLAEAPATRGRALAMLGRLDEAEQAWREAAAADPGDVASRYNLGLARFDRGDHVGARAAWREAATAAPDDFLVLRKIVQAEHRLEMWDAAAATRDELRRRWQVTTDPRARLLAEAVIDQIEAGDRRVFAYETFRPRDPAFHPVLRFVEVDRAGHELPHSVVIETSDYAKDRGAPYVIVVWHHGKRRIVGTAPELPPYPQVRATALALLADQSTQ